MSRYEQVSALIDEGHGYYDMDNGFNNDIIELNVAGIDKSYELNNVWTDKSKAAKLEQSDEFELDGLDFVMTESEGSNESVPLHVQEKERAVYNDGNANQNV